MLSRRRFLSAAASAAVGGLLAACASAVSSLRPSPSPAQPSPTPSASPPPSPSVAPTPAASAIDPSLRERIGQMLLVGFRGLTVDEAEATRREIADGLIGGVILFSVDQPTGGPRNVASPDQVAALVAGLSDAASLAPLMVAIDQEGGRVARLGPANGFPASVSAAELGRGSVEETRAAAGRMADTLRSVGVTLNLAPVVDLAVNPDNPIIAAIERSFSPDPQVVIDHARAFIQAHHERGLACALKHFPGQGSAGADTHLGIVDVTGSWTDRELLPFAALVDEGLADAILTAHIFNADLDPEHPATLSAPTIDGLLRDRIGFERVVISDDLQMGAIREASGYDEAVALAIEAGVDVLLIANQIVYEPGIATRTVDLVERLVRDGRIGEGRIDASWRRITALKDGSPGSA